MEELLVDKSKGEQIKVKVKDIIIGNDTSIFISGPCAVEKKDIMLKIAYKLKAYGVHILRGGAFKPRTSPYSFQGYQIEGLKTLKSVSKEVGIPVVSEVIDIRDIDISLKYIDMIQVGSRNMYNYPLLKELGKMKVPVLLKRGMSATMSEWLCAAEYILSLGNENVVLCERGIRTFEDYTRNTLDLNTVAAIRQKYRLPILVDPSHGTGIRELVFPMSLAAISAGAHGLVIESHISPEESISDSRQTVELCTIKKIIDKVNYIDKIKKIQ